VRFWIDTLTPKQLLFFDPVAKALRAKGHQVLATSRHYREVEQMASMLGIDLTFVGARGGKDPYDQLKASIRRIGSLLPLVAEFKPDASISSASSDCARISFGLRVRHIAVNDSPHSTVAGKLTLPLSSHLLTPWIIPYSAWSTFGLRRDDVTRYRALDPAAWLKRQRDNRDSQPKGNGEPTILVRLEESYAPYMIGTDDSWPGMVLERLASEFKGYNLIALCRYQEQLEGVKRRFGHAFKVPERAVDGLSLIKGSDVFVGMGGTMTTESALLGVPTISAYQGSSLYTEKYLLSKKLLLKTHSLETLGRLVRKSLSSDYRARYAKTAKAVLDSMEDPVEVITGYLLSLR
jgi:uncharacterized protein